MHEPLTLKVFIDNEETEDSALNGQPLPMRKHDTEEIDFYIVDNVSDFIDSQDKDRKYGALQAGGIYYVTTYSPEKLKSMIQEHIRSISVLYNKN